MQVDHVGDAELVVEVLSGLLRCVVDKVELNSNLIKYSTFKHMFVVVRPRHVLADGIAGGQMCQVPFGYVNWLEPLECSSHFAQ